VHSLPFAHDNVQEGWRGVFWLRAKLVISRGWNGILSGMQFHLYKARHDEKVASELGGILAMLARKEMT
jgi:hypothetical protein